MAQHYSNPKSESDPHSLPDIEVFYVTQADCDEDARQQMDEGPDYTAPGWYWWSCSPGCLPDGDPSGPFDSEQEALADAREGADDDDVPCDSCEHAVCDGDCSACEICEEDRLELEAQEPQDDDYYLSDDERSIVYLGKCIVGPVSADPCQVCGEDEHADLHGTWGDGPDGSEEEREHEYVYGSPRDAVMTLLCEYMKNEQYFPNVWSISDHGNPSLISVMECGCYFTDHDGDASKCGRKGEQS